MIPLTDKEFESYSSQEHCFIYRNKIKQEDVYDKTIVNLEIIFIRQVNKKVLHIAYLI